MPSGNFEKAGIALEVAGFTEYINRLGQVDKAHISAGTSAGILAEKLTNLEKLVGTVMQSLTNIRIDADAMGITQVGNSADKAGKSFNEFGEDISEAAQALKKLEVITGTLQTFDRLTQTLVQNTGSLKAGFDNIQLAIRDIDMQKLADQAGNTAVNIGKLATEMKRLEDTMGGNKLVSNLGKLIPLLLAAGDIRSLGDVGRGIGSIISQLTKIDKIPNFEKNQKNFNALIIFVEKLSKLKISGTLGAELTEIGAGFVKFAPGIVAINKVDMKQHTIDGIEQLLKIFQTFSGINLTGFKPLAEGISAISKAFRSFGASDAGSRFTSAAKDIAEAVQILLTALNTFVSQSNSSALIKLIGELGVALKSFAQGASGLGRNFDNTFGNMGKTTEIIVDSLTKLNAAFNKFDDLPAFTSNLEIVSKAVLALSSAFQKISRSESIRLHLRQQIADIIDALRSLGQAELQEAARNIEALVGPITQLATALKFLKGQKIGTGFAKDVGKLGGEFNVLLNVGKVVSSIFDLITRAIVNLAGSLSKLALNTVVGGFKLLYNILSTVAGILIKLPLQAVVIGFKAISFAVQAVVVPIRFLIGLLSSLGNMFTGLFKSKTANISNSLGLKEAQSDISAFETHMDSLRGSFNQVSGNTNTAKTGMLEFGQAADKAGTEVAQLDRRMDGLGQRTSVLGRLFGGKELLQVAGTFKAVDIAGDLVTDMLYGMAYGFTNLIGNAIKATSEFEQLTLQLTSLQAKELSRNGTFGSVAEAMGPGLEQVHGIVTELINEFRVLAIQSPFETNDVVAAFKMAQAFGFTTDEARDLTKTLVDAGSALGFTGKDLSETARIFGQMHTTGKLLAGDMNQLAGRSIGVKQILTDLARETGQLEGETLDFANTTINADDAIKAISNSLKRDFAGAALRSADSIEGLLGSFRSFKEQALQTFAQPIVEGLRPIFSGLADVLFNTEIFDKITAAGERAFGILDKVIMNFASIAGIVANIFGSIPQGFIDFIGLLGQAAAAALAATGGLIGLQFVIGTLATVVTFLLNPLGAVVATIFLVSAAVKHFTSDLMGVTDILRSLGQIIENAFNLQTVETQILLISQLPKNVEPIAAVINDLTVKFSKLLSVIQVFGSIFVQAFQSGTVFTTPIIDSLKSLDVTLQGLGLSVGNVAVFFRNLYNDLATIAQNIYTTVSNAFVNLGSSIGETFNFIVESTSNVIDTLFTMANNVSTFLSSLIEQVGDFGVGVVEAFASGMQSAVNLVVQAVEAIADAISWLLSPGSPPRALPDIDKWGTAAASEFIDGFSDADTSSILKLANGIQDSLGNIRLPDSSSLEDILSTMNWSQDDAGNIVDALGNIIMSQEQLAKSAGDVADELERVNAELAALDKAQNIQKQQNLVNNLKAALKQPGISESNRMVLEQQLKRAELELKRLKLEAEQQGIDTGKGGAGGGSGGRGSKDAKVKKTKEEKIPGEPDQKIPKIPKGKKALKGKVGKDVLDLATPDTGPIEAAIGDPDKGTGLLGRVQKAFEDAKVNIGTAVNGIKDTVVGIFTSIRDELKIIIDEIVKLAGEFGKAFSDAFGTIKNQGPIVGGIAALATATVLTGGWGVLGIIAAGITALAGAWAVASGKVNLDLPDSMTALKDAIDDMRAGFASGGAKNIEVEPGFFKLGPKQTLAESIMGFDINDLARSFGALLAGISEEVGKAFIAVDTALTEAFKAYDEGQNPVLAFFDSLFNLKQIEQTVTTELAGVGTLIASIFNGELLKALSGKTVDIPLSDSLRDSLDNKITGQSFIAKFILDQIERAKQELTGINWKEKFSEVATSIQEGIGSLFNVDLKNTDPTKTSGLFATIQSITDGYTRFIDAINRTIVTPENAKKVDEFIEDLKRLIISIDNLILTGGLANEAMGANPAATKNVAGSDSGATGGSVLSIVIAGITGIFYAVAAIPSVAASVIQAIDSTIRGIGNFVLLVSNMNAGDAQASVTSLEDFMKNIGGVMTSLGNIRSEVFEIISNTLHTVKDIIAELAGIKDPAGLDKTVDAIARLLNELINMFVTIKIAEFLKVAPQWSGLLLALTGLIAGLTLLNQSGDLTGVIDTLHATQTLMLLLGGITAVTTSVGGIKAASLIMPFIIEFVGQLALLAGGSGALVAVKAVAALGVKNAGKLLKAIIDGKILTYIQSIIDAGLSGGKVSIFTKALGFLKTIFSSIADFVTGLFLPANMAATTSLLIGLGLLVGVIASTYVAIQDDIGGLRTQSVQPAFEGFTKNIGELFSGIGKFLSVNQSDTDAQKLEASAALLQGIFGFFDTFMGILKNHDSSFVQLVSDTFASVAGGFISILNSLTGLSLPTELKGTLVAMPFEALTTFFKNIESFILTVFNAVNTTTSFDNADTLLIRIQSILDVLSAFANLGNFSGNKIDLKSTNLVQDLTGLIDKLFTTLDQHQDLSTMDKVIVGILSLTDAIGFLSSFNLDKIGAIVRIMGLLLDTFINPGNVLGNGLTIGAIIASATKEVDDQTPVLQNSVDKYIGIIDRVNAPITVSPPVTIDPTFDFNSDKLKPFLKGQISPLGGGPLRDNSGGQQSSIELPVNVTPTVTVDTVPIDTAFASLNTTTATTFGGLVTTVDTSTTTIKTKVETDFPAIATTIGAAGTDGAATFITGLGTLPTDIGVPLDATVAALNAYGGDKGQFTLAGAGLGEDFATGYITGIDSKKNELIAAVTAYVNAGLLTIPKVQRSASASKVTRGFGQDGGEGYLKGWHDKQSKLEGVMKRFAQAGMDKLVETAGSPRNQAAIDRVINALLPSVFKDKGFIIDFSKWEIHSDSETDVKKRATDSATTIAEQFGNEFARVTNQVFDDITGNNPSLASGMFNTEDINKEFDKELDIIFKHRTDTLAELNDEGKKEFNRNFLAAFTSPQGIEQISQDFLDQFTDEDFFNLPKIYGAIDAFIGRFRDRLTAQAQAGDGWAMGMLGGLDDLEKALKTNVQSVVDEMAAEGTDAAGGSNVAAVGSNISSNIADATVSNESLGGLDSAVTTLTGTLVETITTEFAKITEIIVGQGEASSTGFITGVESVNDTLPTTVGDIVNSFKGYADDFYVAGQKLGKQFADGYVSGIILKLNALEKAATDMITAVKAATKLAQDSKSPSKVAMEIGKDFADGYILGITNEVSNAAAASMELVNAATAPILENNLPSDVLSGHFGIDENVKHEDVSPQPIDDTEESMNALERAAQSASNTFDAFGKSFKGAFDSAFDKFLELNPGAIKDIFGTEAIEESARSAADAITEAIDAIGHELTPEGKGSFGELIKQMLGSDESIQSIVDTFLGQFTDEELADMPDVMAVFNQFIDELEGSLKDSEGFLKESGLSDDVLKSFQDIVTKLREGVQKEIDDLENDDTATAAANATNSWLADMFGPAPATQTEDVGTALAAGIVEGATSPSSIMAIQGAAQEAMDAYIKALRDAGEIHSPSKLTMRLAGEPLADGIILGMRNRLPSIISTARTIGDTVANSFGAGGEWLQRNTFDQKVNMKYNGLVNSLPELFQHVNSKMIGGAGRLSDNIMMSGNSNARTGMLTNYSVINNTNHTQDEYHLHMDVDRNQLGNVRRGFRVARQLGIK